MWASKQDYLGAPPLLTTGGTMTGPLVTAASIAGAAGFNIQPGTTPTSPANGDTWATSASLFFRIGGVTHDVLNNPACTNTPAACAAVFGYANIVWWGAVPGVGGSATVNAAAFNSALATGQPVIVPADPVGWLKGSSTTNMTGGQSIQCQGAAVIFGTGNPMFSITSSQAGTGISGCSFNMAGASPGSTAILLNDAAATVDFVTVQNGFCYFAYGCVTSVGTHGLDTITIRNMRSAFSTGGPQFNIVNAQNGGFIVLDSVVCDFTGVSGSVSWSCGNFNNFAGLLIQGWLNASGLGSNTSTPVFASNVPAWNFSGIAISGSGVIYADDTIGDGVKLSIQFINGPSIYSSINLGTQLILNGVVDSNIASILAFGPQGVAGTPEASAPAVLINGATSRLNIANLYMTKATGNNLDIVGTSVGINIANLTSTNATGAALTLQDSVDNVHVAQGYINGNGSTVTNTSSGTHNVIANLGGYNPVGLTAGIAIASSPLTITAGASPETHYITQSANFNAAVKSGATTLCTVPSATVPCVIQLGPNESYSVTWTTTQPTYSKFVH